MCWRSSVCRPQRQHVVVHFNGVAGRTGFPTRRFNKPPAARTVSDKRVPGPLVHVENIVAVKESAPDTRRFTDFRNAFGDRYVLFAGLDDVALEGLYLGAQGWVSGLTKDRKSTRLNSSH